MKRCIILTALVGLASMLVPPAFAQGGPGGRGVSALVCLAEQVGFEIGNGQVSVDIDDHGVVDGIGEAEVTIHHGKSQSTHLITYQDTHENGHLDCGDVILSVS